MCSVELPQKSLCSVKAVLRYTKDKEMNPIVEKRIDWKKFLDNVESALAGKAFYIKKDLEKYRG